MSEENEAALDEPVMTFELTNGETQETAPAEPVAAEAAPASEEAPEQATTGEADGEEAPQERTKGLSHRILKLNERAERESAARRVAEARAEAAEALLRAKGVEPTTAQADKPLTQADVERLAQEQAVQLAAQAEFQKRVGAMVQAGQQAFSDFDLNCNTLVGLGVLPRSDSTTLAAILEGEAPEKVIQHLAENVDEALAIADLPPIQRTARLAKLDAKLSAPAPKKPPAPVSRAPQPIAPITGTSQRDFDPLNEEDARQMTDAEWAAAMDKRDAAKRKREAERGY